MPATLSIGLTGGIASGKSAAADAFAGRGVPVIDADRIARELVEPGEPALAEVIATFGRAVLAEDGRLDRARLRALIFADAAARRRLESILHPPVVALMRSRLAAIRAPYALLAIPLLTESELKSLVERVLVVDCPEHLQLERLRERDGESEAAARAILAAQASRAARLAIADEVLENSGTLADLDREVGVLHARYLALAAERPAAP